MPRPLIGSVHVTERGNKLMTRGKSPLIQHSRRQPASQAYTCSLAFAWQPWRWRVTTPTLVTIVRSLGEQSLTRCVGCISHANGQETTARIQSSLHGNVHSNRMNSHGIPDPPPQYQDDHDVDEYPSDDQLGDDDLNILSTDYAAQRDLSFYPVTPQHQRDTRYIPSIPPSPRQPKESANGTYDCPEKYQQDLGDGPPVSTRVTSLDKSMFDGSNDFPLPQQNARAYQAHRQRRPLIDLIRNEWQNSPYTSSSSTPTSAGYSTPNWIQVFSAPRFRRYVLVIVSILSLIWVNWHYWAGPQWGEHKLLGESLKDRMKTGGGWFGENLRPEFMDMVHVKTLDQALIPQHGDKKRLIVVGDVHGCHDEREHTDTSTPSLPEQGRYADLLHPVVNLLAEVQYEARTDHLILAGDFISKGPSSPAVVDLAISAHASCVRGNHEDRLLLAYRDMYSHRMTHEQISNKAPPPPMPGMPDGMLQNEPTTDDPIIEEATFEHGDAVDRQLAKSFSKRQVDYMSSCPVILDVGQVKGMGDVHIVHAGLIPGVRLERQDPMGVMHMRTIDLDTHVPSSSTKGIAWYKVRSPSPLHSAAHYLTISLQLWNRYQAMIPAHERSTVIYGHDSRRGLQLHDYSKGLDSGCVRGGKLTAMIIDNGVQGGEARTVSVPCKDYRDPRKEDKGEVE